MTRLCLLLSSLLFLQARSQQLNFRSFSFEQGLNTYNIQKVVQDDYGFIWIATQDGVYRYNGKNFDAFRKRNDGEQGLRENFIFDMHYAGDGRLYVASFNGGIDVVDVRTLSIQPVLGEQSATGLGLPNLWVKKVFSDESGNLWVGGKDFLTVYNAQTKTFTHLRSIPGFRGPVNVTFIRPVDVRTVAVGIEGFGMLLYDPLTVKQTATVTELVPGQLPGSRQISDLIAVQDELYASTNAGLVKGVLHQGRWLFRDLFDLEDQPGAVINSLASDGKANIWVGTNSGLGRLNLHTRKFSFFRTLPGRSRWLQDNTIRHLFVDRQNNLWVSTSKMLQAVNLQPNPFTHYTADHTGTTRMEHIYSLVPKSAHEIFATGTDGLYITNLITGSVQKVKGSGALGVVHHVVQVEPGLWLVSGDAGMYAYQPATGVLSQKLLLQKYPEWEPYVYNYFNVTARRGQTIYWGSEEQEGLLVWNVQKHTIRQYKANTALSKGLPENHIHNIKPDREGNLWLLFDQSVAQYDVIRDTVVRVIRYRPGGNTFNSGIFFDAYDDGTTLWFGTFGGGINGFNKRTGAWQYITEKDGLCNNSVYGILPEKDSVFWVSTNMGLSRVNYISRKCTNYYFEDGLQDNSFDESGALAVNDKLFFGGINGFTMVDLAKYQPAPVSFPVYIHRIEYYHKGQRTVWNDLLWKHLTFPSRTSSVIVHLSALLYSSSRKIKFSYRIKNLHDEFLEVGEDNKIVLNALNSGTYEVEIRYLNEAGVWNSLGSNLHLFITPAWYQTSWFRLLLALLAAALVYGLYRYRISQLLKEQKIRRSIASDLHDDIGSTLTSAKTFTHLSLSAPPPEGQKYLGMVMQNLEQATVSLRDLVWVLDDKLDTVSDLVDRLQRFSMPLAVAMGVDLHFQVEETLRHKKLHKSEKRNLYMIAKEAINNSLKYATCQNIYVRFLLQKKKLLLIIKDDGKGFAEAVVQKGEGLNNIKERARQINYAASIRSAEGSGTEITLLKNV